MTTLIELPKISILIAVYNTGEYIRETIESVLSQDIEKSKYEIILVDDGSTDNSAAIIAEYTAQYPNVRYIYKDNGGAASAFNVGIENALGEFVGFLGSDDLLSPDTLVKVSDFFLTKGTDIDLVSIRLRFFEARTGEHMLNDRFNNGDRIIDITHTPTEIQLACGGCFVRRQSLISNNLRLREDLRIAEDATFLQQVIMLRNKYGVLEEPVYYYRKRNAGTSLLDQTLSSKETFIPVLRNAWKFLFDTYRNNDGSVPVYLQYVVAYEIQWRFKAVFSPLSIAEIEEYRTLLRLLLVEIEDQIIMNQKHTDLVRKIYMLSLKYNEDVYEKAVCVDNVFYYRGLRLFAVREDVAVANVYVLENKNKTLSLEGLYDVPRFKGLQHGFLVDGVFKPVNYTHSEFYAITFLGDKVWDRNLFSFSTSCREIMSLRPAILLPSGKIIEGMLNLARCSFIPNFNTGYRVYGDRIITNWKKRELRVSKLTPLGIIKNEIPFIGRIWAKKIYRPKDHSRIAIVFYRLLALWHKLFSRGEKVWLISDRADAAEDNGEAFFRYVMEHKPADVRPYFLLSEKAPSYNALRKLGNVVDPRSSKAKRIFLRADKIISSQADDYVVNFFARDEFIMRGLYGFDFVFLQHGVTKDDQSGWFNKFAKNVKVLVTSSKDEWESIQYGKYGYVDGEVVLTGMPRFDRLENRPQKKIIVAPTWRKYLSGKFDPINKEISYNPDFKDSEYFHFWQSLILDPRLNKVLEKAGYTADFWLHPSHFVQVEDFRGTERFHIGIPPYDYKKGISESSVFVTDFSSAVFDFAYLKKSVIYSQFDLDEFRSGHIYSEGYFSYEDDGFGPLCFDYESTVDAIIDAVESDGAMSLEYQLRVEKFFAFNDRNNSERVLEAILRLDEK